VTQRVLFITGEYPPMRGGIADYTALLVDALSGQGWESYVLTSRRAEAAEDARVLACVGRWDTSIFQQTRDALDRTGADIVHIQYQTGAFEMRPSINLLPYQVGRGSRRVPVVTTFHDLRAPYLFPRAGRLRRWANRLLAFGSDAVVFTNERDFRQVRRFSRVARRIHHIPIGSNLPEIPSVDRAAVLNRLDLDPDAFTVGFFGFMTPDKGVEDLIEAIEGCSEPRPQLVIIGGEIGSTDSANAEYQRRLRARLNRMESGVAVTGYISPREAAEMLAAVDLVVLPFRQGASLRSGSLIAALRSGTPVIATDPRPEDSLRPLTPGESIWLVPAGEPAVLGEAIDLMRREPTLHRRLAWQAALASEAFNWASIAERHARLYEEIG
jgi:glycosyltransferase involved in cell wall biosynthesis